MDERLQTSRFVLHGTAFDSPSTPIAVGVLTPATYVPFLWTLFNSLGLGCTMACRKIER
jgi:hypothetical protein